MRNALQYSEVIMELFKAIDGYQSEYENPAPCGVMKNKYRQDIFRLTNEIKEMGKNPCQK